MLIKIVVIGLIGTFLSLLIKQYRPDMAIAVPLLTTLAILALCIPYLSDIINMCKNIATYTGINSEHIKTVLKIISVAYICQFASDICKDAGEASISGRIELGGKLTIITLMMPVVISLLSIVSDIINF